MVNALELFENFKNAQTQRALAEAKLRLAPLQEQQMQFELAKGQQGLLNDQTRLGMLAHQQQIAEELGRRKLDVMAQAAQMRGLNQRPQITQIVDPLDPSKMIAVDINKYNETAYRQGNRNGVIGMAGREPTSAKREEKASEGKDLLASELENLRTYYNTLNEARAIPSSSRPTLSNIGSSVQASTPGQMLGRLAGTKEQDARNQIASSRLRVMNAIKNATGMSAQQLNSNVELKTWLDSLTDPSKTYESNMGIINAIEDAFVKGTGRKSGALSTPNASRDNSPSRSGLRLRFDANGNPIP